MGEWFEPFQEVITWGEAEMVASIIGVEEAPGMSALLRVVRLVMSPSSADAGMRSNVATTNRRKVRTAGVEIIACPVWAQGLRPSSHKMSANKQHKNQSGLLWCCPLLGCGTLSW